MQYESITANDGATLAYKTSVAVKPTAHTTPTNSNPPKTCILLLHGFSGSSEYFKRNTDELSQHHWVLAPDLRGHGRSSRTRHGHHVARLAMDLHEVITSVIHAQSKDTKVYAIGCSIGAAVLWTYTELFTDADFAGFVFVDQAPLQDRSLFGGWGEGLAHYGCYDERTALEAQRAWSSGDEGVREETYRGLVEACLGYRFARGGGDEVSEEQERADEEFFTAISRSCDGEWLARLLGDHTRYDHRDAIELIEKPVLVMAGKRSGCFSIEGMKETVRRKREGREAQFVVFNGGHWLFWEQPERFNKELLDFVKESEEI